MLHEDGLGGSVEAAKDSFTTLSIIWVAIKVKVKNIKEKETPYSP